MVHMTNCKFQTATTVSGLKPGEPAVSNTFSIHPFTVFSKPDCEWCDKAKEAIKNAGTYHNHFYERVVGKDLTPREFLDIIKNYTTSKTVPQIFHKGKYIGGYNELCDYLEGIQGGFGDGGF